MNMKTMQWMGMLVAGMVLSGCFYSGSLVGPGDVEGTTPPRLVVNANKEIVWDNPGNFGPIPAHLKASGDQVCRSINGSRATGYHAKAMNENGLPFPNGGFYCVKD
ncbi:MAG: hypothetical protein G8345_21140 [Magnetococcales bacterium]|nr:hypothetical protein [Magnetococcales bacterium]NGZ29378.1 hypothetical protein [Magnetococcales bacterium]